MHISNIFNLGLSSVSGINLIHKRDWLIYLNVDWSGGLQSEEETLYEPQAYHFQMVITFNSLKSFHEAATPAI